MAGEGDPRIRILHLVTQMELGGAQKAMLHVAAGLDPTVYDSRASVLYTKNRLNPLAEQLGCEVIDFQFKTPGASFLRQAWGSLAGALRLYRYLRRHRFHVLQSYCYYANVFAAVLGRLAGVPLVVMSQRNSYHSKGRLSFMVDRWASRLAHGIIAVCDATRNFSIEREGFSPGKIITIHNGLDGAAAAGIKSRDRPDGELVLVTAARLLKKKGIHILLDALARLPTDPPWRLWILGDGPEREALLTQARCLNMADRVDFYGWRADVLSFIGAADLFVLPSYEEGFPNVLLEAMARGKPIVATAVDGNPEAVVDGSTGLLVPAGDPLALAIALRRLLSDEEERRRMGEAGRRRCLTEFNLSRMIRSFDAYYRARLKAKYLPVRLCLVCSSGGHLLQLHMLREWWLRHDRCWVTFDKTDARSMLTDERVHWAYHPTNRNLPNLLRNLVLACRVLWREKPDLVVSTGAGVAIPFLLVARLSGRKTIYIEEFNRIRQPTLTGRIVHHFVHRFLVQWPEMLPFYSRAEYHGGILGATGTPPATAWIKPGNNGTTHGTSMDCHSQTESAQKPGAEP
ncbi:glycosyltransferase [bacterium]|nr:glycosyltransferase [candidate division CSSED10-310 bacterium]